MHKYGLPATHATYLDRSAAEWLEEMYEDLYLERDAHLDGLEALGGMQMDAKARTQQRTRLVEQLRRVCLRLDESMPDQVRDDVLDTFDAKIAAGEDVDLQQLMPKNWRPRA